MRARLCHLIHCFAVQIFVAILCVNVFFFCMFVSFTKNDGFRILIPIIYSSRTKLLKPPASFSKMRVTLMICIFPGQLMFKNFSLSNWKKQLQIIILVLIGQFCLFSLWPHNVVASIDIKCISYGHWDMLYLFSFPLVLQPDPSLDHLNLSSSSRSLVLRV
jgi:hypothetical protein